MNTHISSGGIVYRWNQKQLEVLLLYRSGTGTYHFPKGTQEVGESLEDTALREIYEETGYHVTLETHIASVPSSFEKNGVRVQKQTHYFSAGPISGPMGMHDTEHDTVAFVPYEEALGHLSVAGGHSLGYEDEYQVLLTFTRIQEQHTRI